LIPWDWNWRPGPPLDEGDGSTKKNPVTLGLNHGKIWKNDGYKFDHDFFISWWVLPYLMNLKANL
jgi:hypothetical protein